MKKLIACGALVALSALTACGAGDVSPDELTEALVDQGVDQALADCITDDLEARLSDDDFQTVAKADENLSGVDAELEAEIEAAIETCALAQL